MTEVPKIVVDRLRVAELAHAASSPSHPDADLLTAFAEQALSAPERDSVLQHLAACKDCRELISLALSPEAVAIAPCATETEALRMPLKTNAEKNWLSAFAWPTLRWAALAAGVIVSSSLLLLRHGNVPVPVPAHQQAAAIAPEASAPQMASSSAPQALESLAENHAPLRQEETPLDRRPKASPKVESGILITDAKKADAQRDKSPENRLSPATPPALDSPAARSLNEPAEVFGAAADFNPAPSAASNLIARNEAPAVEKAKPAPPEIAVQQTAVLESAATGQMKPNAAGNSGSAPSATINNAYAPKKETSAKDALAPSFTLRITAGFLQRSVDNGLTWQLSLHPDHPLLCYAILGRDVWTGGEAGTLFHSTDGGVTWAPVQPAVNAQSLSTDVVSIKFQGPEMLVSISNHESWSTADGGQTWEKK